MTTHAADPLETVIRKSGEDWLIDFFSPPEEALAHLHETLEAVESQAKRRCAQDAPQLSAAAILDEYERNPHKIKAFLQALGSTSSPNMLLMAWRLLEGMEITHVKMEYILQDTFSLHVVLAGPDGGPPEVYDSSDIDDAALLRHLGILKMNGQPVFEGFYPLKVGD